MLRVLLFIVFLIPMSFTVADEFTQYSRVDCLPSLGFFKIDYDIMYTVSEGTAQSQNTERNSNRYEHFKNTSCVLPRGKFEFEFTEVGRDNSDFYLTIKFKNKIILERVYLEVAGFNSYGDKFSLKNITGFYLDSSSTNPVIEALFEYGNSGMYVNIIFNPEKQSFNIKELSNAVENELKTKISELPKSIE